MLRKVLKNRMRKRITAQDTVIRTWSRVAAPQHASMRHQYQHNNGRRKKSMRRKTDPSVSCDGANAASSTRFRNGLSFLPKNIRRRGNPNRFTTDSDERNTACSQQHLSFTRTARAVKVTPMDSHAAVQGGTSEASGCQPSTQAARMHQRVQPEEVLGSVSIR